MKEHESRLSELGEIAYWFNDFGRLEREHIDEEWLSYYPRLPIDSNNFVHSLDGSIGDEKIYTIHGKKLSKEQWEIERNRLLMLEELGI